MTELQDIRVTVEGTTATITLDKPEKRNALSLDVMRQLTAAFEQVGATEARAIVLAANGKVFSAGHDFADMAGADLGTLRRLLLTCRTMMDTIQSVPQPVVARVHGLATAAGCQLVATCDLAIASDQAGFAAPGGKGGLFCHTPMVAISRNLSRKHAFELGLTGDPISAEKAERWGLVNEVVPHDTLDDAVAEMVRRITRGSPLAQSMGKHTLYAHLDMAQDSAYDMATEVMAANAMTNDGQEGIASFLEKRRPTWSGT